MQETQVRFPIQEDPKCPEATKAVRHNYWACAPEPGSHNHAGHTLQLTKPMGPRDRACATGEAKQPRLCNRRGRTTAPVQQERPNNEKPVQNSERVAPASHLKGKPVQQRRTSTAKTE